MKKFYLLFIIVFAYSSTFGQIVNIPNTVFKNYLLNNPTQEIAVNQYGDFFEIDVNDDGEIQLSEALEIRYLAISNYFLGDITGVNSFLNLVHLECANNNLQQLEISSLTNLTYLDAAFNSITSLNVANASGLIHLNASNTLVTQLDASGLQNLDVLFCIDSPLQSLNVSGCDSLRIINVTGSQLQSLDVTSLENLEGIQCANNEIATLTVGGNTLLELVAASDNLISNFNAQECPNLWAIDLSNNLLTSIDLSNLPLLDAVHINSNNLTNINLAGTNNVSNLYVNNNQLTTLDISHFESSFIEIRCDNNNLTTLFLKNGVNEFLSFDSNEELQYICADVTQFNSIAQKVAQYGLGDVETNSYCSFTPGGNYSTVTGVISVDMDSNGCDANDDSVPMINFQVNSGSNSSNFVTSGDYTFGLTNGQHTIFPILDNPAFFTVSPATATVSFPFDGDSVVKNFCIIPNGVHPDIEVVLLPIGPARPGFNSDYKIIFRNKGTEIQNGIIAFTYDDSVLDFISANPMAGQTIGNLSWTFTSLAPFETREIAFVLNANSPMETPAVNGGDIFNFTASVISGTDETPEDNIATLAQTVVNSFDPNDKTCVEGTTVGPDMIGEYVHYVIRFENTGTFPAENIVVKDMIDLSKFDIATLVPLNASHTFETRINSNKVEFIFENIMLPFDDATNDGYVAFKIKTLPTLAIGDTFSNSASIYFDYNFPIVTDPAITTIQNLGNADFEFEKHFTIYPNPSSNVVNIKSSGDITVKTIDVYNILGQLVIAIPNAQTTLSIDISQLKTGTYFLKINSDKGTTNAKFVRN